MSFPYPAFWRRPRRAAKILDGQRIYAIGDVHGSAELLSCLIDRILTDSMQREHRDAILIVLGDFIDRGDDSAAIVRSLYSQRRWNNLVVLLGNHEAAMIAAYRGDRNALTFWLQFGGAETLRSFGADFTEDELVDIDAMEGILRRHIPFELINWMETLPTSYRAGGYLFVHAGIRPGVRIARQRPEDLLWIRDAFLNSKADHGLVIVHGHSPVAEVEFKSNRICVDTGACRSGILSAVGFEEDVCWVIDTR